MRYKIMLLVFILGVSLSLLSSCNVFEAEEDFKIDKVGIVLYGSPLQTYSKDYYMFSDLEKTFNDKETIVMYKDNVEEENVDIYLADFAKRQYKIVFVENRDNSHEINEVAKTYPDTIFVVINNDIESQLANIMNVDFDTSSKYELAGYLSGSVIARENLYYPYRGKKNDKSNKIKRGLVYYNKANQLVSINVNKEHKSIWLQMIYNKHKSSTSSIQNSEVEGGVVNQKVYTGGLVNGYILADTYLDKGFIKAANEEGYGVVNIGNHRDDSVIYNEKGYENNISLDIYYDPIYKETLKYIDKTGKLKENKIIIKVAEIYGVSGKNVLSDNDIEKYINNEK